MPDPTTQDVPVAGGDYKPGDPRSDLMNPETRDRLLTLLAALGREHPSMRFGQLICALTSASEAAIPDSIYDIEDRELLKSAEDQLKFLRANR